MLLRVVVVTTLLASAIYIESTWEPVRAFNPFYLLIIATYLVTLGAVMLLRLGAAPATIAFVQATFDLFFVTSLVYLAGVSEPRSGFIVLYPLAVLAAATLMPPRAAITIAIAAVVAFVALYVSLGAGYLPGYGGSTGGRFPGTRVLLYSTIILAVSCVGVAWIGGYLMERLRAAGASLELATDQVSSLRELNQAIVASIHSGLMTVDAEGRILYVNDRGAAILEADRRSLRGSLLAVVLKSPHFEPALLEARVEQRLGRDRTEVAVGLAERGTLVLGLSVAPLTAGDPALGRYLVTFQDLTDIKKLENESRINEKLAAIGEMAAQLAHEIRNPLGAISGSAQVLLREDGVGEEQAELLNIIRTESKRLSDALNQFLRGARPAGSSFQPIDLGPVVEETVALLRNSPELLPSHSIQSDIAPGPHICLADADSIKQVAWNLARNGIEAMPAGGCLRVSVASSPDEVTFKVADQGRGIDAATAHRLFEPFHTGSKGGTGIGLAIVYAIVKEHRGRITIRNLDRGGAEVDVRLPGPAS